MTLRVCCVSGCPDLTRGSRCENHQRQARRESDAKRPNAAARGYGPRWRKTRDAYLRAHPYCECDECAALPIYDRQRADDVHHCDGLGPNGPRGHDWSNLQALYHPHHSKITAIEQPGGWNA